MTWDQYLDTFEGQLQSAETSLQTSCEFDAALLAAFQPPVGLGPMPSQLIARASSLVDRNNALQAKLHVALTNVADQLADVKRESSAVRGYNVSSGAVPQYFDNNA